MAGALPDNGTLGPMDDATTFASALADQVNREDIPSMVHIQREMLGRFEKTNEMLINFNMLSLNRYEATVKDFQKHTQLLFEMKKDLDSIFKRIRLVKARLEKTYPESFAACNNTYTVPSDDEDEDNEDSRPRAYSGSQGSNERCAAVPGLETTMNEGHPGPVPNIPATESEKTDSRTLVVPSLRVTNSVEQEDTSIGHKDRHLPPKS